jgi:hypothetical protein
VKRRSAGAATVAVAVALLPIALARADTTSLIEAQNIPGTAADGWQAGPCTTDAPACSPQTPQQFYKQAGGHPPVGFVQFIVRHAVVSTSGGLLEPLAEPFESRVVKDVRVDLPPGLSINPEATPRKCSLSDFLRVPPLCEPDMKIGETIAKAVFGPDGGAPAGFGEPPGLVIIGGLHDPLYNLQPSAGEPALFGAMVGGGLPLFLKPELDWDGDFHESFSIFALPDYETARLGGIPNAPFAIHTARLVTNGTAGDGTFATLPTTCFNADEPQFSHLYSSWIRADSYGQPDPSFPFGSTAVEEPLPAGTGSEGCERIPFDPSLGMDPGTNVADSPASPTVAIKLPVQAPSKGGTIAESQLRRAEVTLPEGMGLNPAGSADLLACSDAQFHKGDRSLSNECPEQSILGSAEIKTPVLSEPLLGKVYVGEPKSTDPASGDEFRILVEAKAPERGVAVRLIGNLKADPKTAQLTALFDEQEVSPISGQALPRGLPQVPLESVTLNFDGPHAILTSPPTCSTLATGRLEPWARPGTQASVSDPITLTSLPGGKACPAGMAARPFAPFATVKPDSSRAGAYSPLRLRIERSDGEQELKRIDLTLPKGVIGRLAGIPYCPEAAIAAAAGKSGLAERSASSCPAASLVGTTSAAAGSGGEPLALPGKVYLAGPYQGAPLSLVAITPAVSGPFDLGTVVIRVALNLDPTSAQIHAVSDVIPDLFSGVKLDLKTINLKLDRTRFMLNPTNCSAQATGGTIAGGGADPTNPASFSAYSLQVPFKALGCPVLGFAPRLTTTLAGPTRRNTYPSLKATLQTSEGEANLASVALTLPHAFLVAQEHIADVCTKPRLASHTCPPSSVYGKAEARSPLLDDPLKGSVYLVPGGHPLPDLVADLRGQVEIQLHGVIGSSSGGRIKVAFDSVPDVPVSEFVLQMAAGKKSLIVNSTDICKGKKNRRAQLSIAAQNGKQVQNKRYALKISGCKKHKHKKHKRHRKH